MTADATARPTPPAAGAAVSQAFDLRPLFAPRSVAIVGASPRGWIAETVRDNLRVMGSATRCHFVNPKYDELLGQPCYPSLASLPGGPGHRARGPQPAARRARSPSDAAEAGIPAVIIPGGGVVEGGAAAAAMQREVADIARRARHRPRRARTAWASST